MTIRSTLSGNVHRLATALLVTVLLASCAGQRGTQRDEITISVLGTNDVHGQLLPARDRGGLVAISAYVDALRDVRNADGGAVLVIDAGDMWQGTLESNLVEGAAVVEAYNAIGYDAATIGNHEFDFGPAGSKAIPEEYGDDPRGALKLRASEAGFPVLAANIIDESTGRPVVWENVRPSVMLNVKSVIVGIVGVVTERALRTTISANTPGLRIAPLVETISKEAAALRNNGATVVIVTAHAGGACSRFDDPADLSSCDLSGEIMRVAEALPAALVDHIIAGHVHEGIAHIVNGISITASYSSTRAFSRVDLRVDRGTRKVASRTVHAPHPACLSIRRSTGACASTRDLADDVVTAVYEGREVVANPKVVEIAAGAAAVARQTKDDRLGVYLETAFVHPPATESALANLMTDAIRESTDADIAIHNVVGGIRNNLPQGDLTFGAVYEMLPFDNRVVEIDMTGAQLRQIIAGQAFKDGRRAGFSGMRVFVACASGSMDIAIKLDSGRNLLDGDRVRVAVNDFLAMGGDDILTPAIPEGGFDTDDGLPLTRDVLVEWFRSRGGVLTPGDFDSTGEPRWNLPDRFPTGCAWR